MECRRDSSLPHLALMVVVVGRGTAVPLMRFFSRFAIYIWDRRPPSAPHLAIELVELMQAVKGGGGWEGGGGVLAKRENNPTASSGTPFTSLSINTQTVLTLLIN